MARPSRHILVLTLLAAVLPLTACGSDDDADPTRIGDVVSARGGVDTEGAPKSFVIVPSGRLDIRAGKPVDSLSAELTTEREARPAPEGGVFVPITWTFTTGTMGKFVRIFGRALPIEMTLISGGESYQLRPPVADSQGNGVDAYYVAVEGTGEQVDLEIEYAGVTQTLDLVSGERSEGQAAALYDIDAAAYSEKLEPCATAGWIDEGPFSQSTFTCEYSVALTVPFVDGEWAPEGKVFTAVGLTSNLTAFAVYGASGAAATYTATTSKEKSTIDGRGPTRMLGEQQISAGFSAGILVFTTDGPPKKLTFHRTFQLVRSAVAGEIDAPYQRKLDVIGTLPLT